MVRLPKVAISFEFEPALVFCRREEAPHAKYCGISRTWKAPALEADAFVARVDRVDRVMRAAGRTVTISVDYRPVTVGIPDADAPTPADAPSLQPSI